jgi:hypothetical protein
MQNIDTTVGNLPSRSMTNIILFGLNKVYQDRKESFGETL